MTKYHPHETILATGPATDEMPSADDLTAGMRPQLRPLVVGPVYAPGTTIGVKFATYVFLPDGEDSWEGAELGGDEARHLFAQRIAVWLPDFEVVRVQYGSKAHPEAIRYDATAEDLP